MYDDLTRPGIVSPDSDMLRLQGNDIAIIFDLAIVVRGDFDPVTELAPIWIVRVSCHGRLGRGFGCDVKGLATRISLREP